MRRTVRRHHAVGASTLSKTCGTIGRTSARAVLPATIANHPRTPHPRHRRARLPIVQPPVARSADGRHRPSPRLQTTTRRCHAAGAPTMSKTCGTIGHTSAHALLLATFANRPRPRTPHPGRRRCRRARLPIVPPLVARSADGRYRPSPRSPRLKTKNGRHAVGTSRTRKTCGTAGSPSVRTQPSATNTCHLPLASCPDIPIRGPTAVTLAMTSGRGHLGPAAPCAEYLVKGRATLDQSSTLMAVWVGCGCARVARELEVRV